MEAFAFRIRHFCIRHICIIHFCIRHFYIALFFPLCDTLFFIEKCIKIGNVYIIKSIYEDPKRFTKPLAHMRQGATLNLSSAISVNTQVPQIPTWACCRKPQQLSEASQWKGSSAGFPPADCPYTAIFRFLFREEELLRLSFALLVIMSDSRSMNARCW